MVAAQNGLMLVTSKGKKASKKLSLARYLAVPPAHQRQANACYNVVWERKNGVSVDMAPEVR